VGPNKLFIEVTLYLIVKKPPDAARSWTIEDWREHYIKFVLYKLWNEMYVEMKGLHVWNSNIVTY